MTNRLKLGLVLGSLALAHAAAQTLDEYQVKAAFVCNFANFVEWPAAAFRNPKDPFVICVVGRSPFGHALENLAEGKSLNGHAFAVRQVSDAAQASGCQIAFLSMSERLRFRSILDGLKTTSVLTVGDTADFVAEGGMIALRLDNGRIRMRMNADAARERNLRISSHLLRLAEGAR